MQLPIYEVWIQSWTMQDALIFGSLTVIAVGVMVFQAVKRRQ